MKWKNDKLKFGILFGSVVLLLFFSFLLNIALGAVKIPLDDVVSILCEWNRSSNDMSEIVWNIRFPRAVGALFGGAALAGAGILLQIFFKNPIVEPFVLGVSSGSVLCVALVTLGGFSIGLGALSPFMVFIAAFAGAMVVTMIAVSFAGRVKSVVTLLVIGLMIGYICSAVTNILVAFADKEELHGFMMWTMGSFSGFTWNNIFILIVVGVPIMISMIFLVKPLNAFLMGEEYAKSMGVNISVLRVFIVIIASILAAIVTAFAGPIAFIGLAVPHIARLVFGTSDNKILLPGTLLIGALITLLCDLVSRTIFSPAELPISAVTSFIGAPIVICLILKRRSSL